MGRASLGIAVRPSPAAARPPWSRLLPDARVPSGGDGHDTFVEGGPSENAPSTGNEVLSMRTMVLALTVRPDARLRAPE